MGFSCGCDDSEWECVSDDFRPATEPGKCIECEADIKPGDTEYVYIMELSHEDGPLDDLDEDAYHAWLADPESDVRRYRHCEKCGDLSLSVSGLGFCYSFGDLIESHREYVDGLKGGR